MKWIIFNVACVLSLLLCSAIVVLWFRSYRTADFLAYCQQRREYGVISTVGQILIYDEKAIEPFLWKAPFGFQRQAWRAPDSIAAYAMPNAARRASWMGFGVMSGDNGKFRASAGFVPHWAVVLLLSILPLLWLRLTLRKRTNRGFEMINQPELAGQNKSPTA